MRLFIINGAKILLNLDLAVNRILATEFAGKEKVMRHLKEYNKRKKQGPWGLEELAEFFKGVKKEDFEEKAHSLVKENLKKGAKEFIQRLKDKGFRVVFYTSDFNEAAQALKKEFNLDEILGTELEFKEGICTGKLLKKVDRYDRAEKIKNNVEENKLSKDDVVILGESVTALPSKKYGKLIIINPRDEQLKKEADLVVSSFDEVIENL